VGLMPSQEYNEQLLHLHLIELDRIGATKIISPSLKLYAALKASDILDKRGCDQSCRHDCIYQPVRSYLQTASMKYLSDISCAKKLSFSLEHLLSFFASYWS
jgi:hypothetical protein